jgi:succinate dehydrogenase / fumarate reductase cytochrome b subunit
MRRVVKLYRSTVGKKVMMALSGVVLAVFVLVHMIGNLKMLGGYDPATPEESAMNVYAGFLREVGYPLVPHESLLWAARIALLVAVLVHVIAAFKLWGRSRAARVEGYGKLEDLSFSYASRTMRWGGVILLLFIVYHILHFTTGHAHPDFVHGDVYLNFVVAFSSPLVYAVYLVAQTALAFHLYHGVWSGFQTLGANHPRYNPMRRPFALTYALVVFVGFMLPPTLVLLGIMR